MRDSECGKFPGRLPAEGVAYFQSVTVSAKDDVRANTAKLRLAAWVGCGFSACRPHHFELPRQIHRTSVDNR